MNNSRMTYATSDLPLITMLSIDFPVTSIDRSNHKKILFNFKNSESLLARINEYWQGSLTIEPQRFYTQMKYIKSQIYGGNNHVS